MNQKLVVPELNYWIRQVLQKSPINEKFFKVPSDTSDYWRDSNSVLDLLFNENFISTYTPISSSSSSSSDESQFPDKPYIYIYRTCEIKKIPDKKLIRRINIYRYNIDIYAASSEKFIDLFDLTNSPIYVNMKFEEDDIQDQLDILNTPNEIPSVPYTDNMDKTAQNSPYFTYKSQIHFSTNFQLVRLDDDYKFDPPPPEPLPSPPTNVFSFTEEEFMMLDLLYDYKTYAGVDISNIVCNQLVSPLSKCIFIYLNICINDNLNSCPSDTKFSDGTNLLHSIYEKYVLDIIYRLKQKDYSVIYKPSDIINDKTVEINQDFLMVLKHKMDFVFINEENLANKKIILKSEYLPWDRRDFSIFHNGLLLQQDVDYRVQIQVEDPTNPYYEIDLLSNIFTVGDKLVYEWSYLQPASAFSQETPEEILSPKFNPSEIIEEGYQKLKLKDSYLTHY